MIDKALLFLQEHLNREFKIELASNENFVVASHLANPDGSVVESNQDKVVISIVNIEHETAQHYTSDGNNTFGKTTPPVNLSLYVLITSNHSNYFEAYKRLSMVIAKFRSSSYFTSNDFPNIPDPITKLTLEIFNIPLTELSHVWSGIGANYVPSIVYKMRMVTL